MNASFHSAYWFAQLPDLGLSDFAGGVITGFTDNSDTFKNPPVSIADVTAEKTAYDTSIAALTGDPQATAAKNNERVKLIRMLRKLAAYAQSIAGEDLATLLLSGFPAASTNHASAPLDTPNIVAIINEVSTQLLVRVTPVLNARNYEVQISTTGADWKTVKISSQARRIVALQTE